MELYTLDGLLRRTELVEGYESFIWTERYADIGEIEIVLASTQQHRNLLASGTFIGLSESKRVMKIDTISDTEGADGIKKLTVTGKEFSNILHDRVTNTGLVGEQVGTWASSGRPSTVIRALFDYVCRNGSSDITDKLPFLIAGSLYPPGNLPEDTASYTIERTNSSLFAAIKELADVWDLGFRLYKGPDTGKLYFDVYKGNDLTSSQTVWPAVIFSPDLDTLQDISELSSIVNSKNVALVMNDNLTVTVYADGADVNTSGFAKRVLMVSANDVKYAERTNTLSADQETAINKANAFPNVLEDEKAALSRLIQKTRLMPGDAVRISSVIMRNALTAAEQALVGTARDASVALEPAEQAMLIVALTQRGQEELAKNRSISAFDGEITQLSPYKYTKHYNLGDLVEMRNTDGLTNQMLVTEQIFAADETGERAYPTLTMKLFITPGSWLAWENTQVWQNAPGTWATA